MSRPSKYSSHILISDEDIAARRAVRTNLLLSVTLTGLLWICFGILTAQHGLSLIVLYLFAGTVDAVRNMALAPLYYFDRKHPALASLWEYAKITLLWLPKSLHVTYLGVREALSWDDDDFRMERMMNRLENQRDSMTDEEFDDGAIEGG